MDTRYYSITALGPEVTTAGNRGEMTFTVTNTTDKALRTEFSIEPAAAAKREWFTIERPLREIPAKAADQIKVTVAAPADADGDASFLLISTWKDRPDEFFTKGPAVGLKLKKTGETPIAPPPSRAWIFIVIAAVLVLLIGGGVTWWLLSGDDDPVVVADGIVAVPAVESLSAADALTKLRESGLTAKEVATQDPGAAVGIVFEQNPRAGIKVKAGTEVQLLVRR